MQINYLALILSSLVPFLVGFIWYHPKTMGTIWLKVSGVDPAPPSKKQMTKIFLLTYLFSLMIAFYTPSFVVHQNHIYSTIFNHSAELKDPNSSLSLWVKDFNDKYGNEFRTFKHGAFHGFLLTLFFVLPLIGINALFEKKGSKYIFIHFGYWAIVMILVGGIMCGLK